MENTTALAIATLLLVLIPGPNAALIVANSLRHGLKFGLYTVLGTTAGIALQLALVVAGMAVLIAAAATALAWIKWLGVAYLIYLGVRSLNVPVADLQQNAAQSPSCWKIVSRSLLLALINPKTLLFNAAFLPQFVGDGASAAGQLVLLASVFLSVIAVGDSIWALTASSARGWLSRFGRLRNKLSGGFLIGAGVGLALSNRPA